MGVFYRYLILYRLSNPALLLELYSDMARKSIKESFKSLLKPMRFGSVVHSSLKSLKV